MPNIEIKETKYYNCPYCHRIIPGYAICNCVKIYNQALEDLQKMIDYEYYDGGYGDYHDVEMIVRMIEQLKK